MNMESPPNEAKEQSMNGNTGNSNGSNRKPTMPFSSPTERIAKRIRPITENSAR